MRTLFLLLRNEFRSLVNSVNKKNTTSFVLAAVGLAIAALILIGMFAIIGGATAYTLTKKGLGEYSIFVSLALSMIIALMFGVMNSTRDARSSDTDMLLAMPIPKSSIVISKLLGMYLLDVLCALVLLVPSYLIVWFVGDGSAAVFGRGLFFAFLIPALPLFISLLVSALIGFLKKATKFGQLVSTMLSFVVLILYMIVVPNLSSYAEKLNISADEATSIMKKIPPFYWITEAIYSGKIIYVVLTLLITLIPMALAVYIHARSLNGVDFHADNSKKARSYKSASPRKAVLSMEFRRYFSSTNYIMNTLFGTLFLIVLTGYVVAKGGPNIDIVEEVTVNGEKVDLMTKFTGVAWAAIWTLFINFFSTITITTPPSVSMEGKRIWINKSLPIATKDILLSKLLVSVAIFQPVSIICSIVLSIMSRSGILSCLLLIIMTCLFHLLCSMIGLIFGLVFVNIDWTNEAQVIKKGFAVTLTMILNFVFAFIFAAGLIVSLIIGSSMGYAVLLGSEILLLTGLCIGAYAIITHYGVRKYESLNG